jgi:hypothetical protein
MKHFIPKFSNTTDMNEDSSSACKNLGGNTFHTHTVTSISEKDLENAPVGTLESKLDIIMQKRAKRIEIFENYLNDWEKIKVDKSKSVTPKADKPKRLVAKNLVKKPVLRAQPSPKPSFKPPQKLKSTPTPIQKPKSMKQNNPAKSSRNVKSLKKVTTSLYLSRLNPNGINNLTSLIPILRKGTPANARYAQK